MYHARRSKNIPYHFELFERCGRLGNAPPSSPCSAAPKNELSCYVEPEWSTTPYTVGDNIQLPKKYPKGTLRISQ